LSNMGL